MYKRQVYGFFGLTDSSIPSITILGDNPLEIELGTTYTEFGINTSDQFMVTLQTTSNVDINTVGQYTVVYTVTDSASKTAQATRIVNVIDPDAQ